MTTQMSAMQQFTSLGFSEDEAVALQSGLSMLLIIKVESIDKALRKIDMTETMGPFQNPTFFVHNRDAFKIGRENKEFFKKLKGLIELVKEQQGK